MLIDFHEEAKKNFNAKADELLLQLNLKPNVIRADEFKSKVPAFELKKEDILSDFFGSIQDPSGEIIAVYFLNEDKEIGFIDEPFNNYIRLCEGIQKSHSIKNIVSQTTIRNIVFEWCKDKYKGKTNDNLIEYIKKKIEPEILEREIWIPIFQTEVEGDIIFSNARITTLDSKIFEKWYESVTQDKDEDSKQKISFQFEKEREEIEGYAVAVVKTIAEQERAYEIATNEIEAVLDYIRFFSAANFYPKLTSQLTEFGKEHLRTSSYFTVIDNKLCFTSKKVLDKGFIPWRISRQFYEKILIDGLKCIETLHCNSDRTEFQTKILEALRLYSSSLLMHNLSSRLIYILTAVEGLLLRNNTESIQDNVSRRLAFTISKEKLERQKIARNFKEIYSIRSKFIHHAEQITRDEFIILTKFILNVWRFFIVILHSPQINTKEEFINRLEDSIFS
ncbi:MAG: hypothetical protein GXX85_15950 [Ignavibacteria bacterium]|nr:hypothetical protein [Ignavibacteria bacterium]